MEEFIKLNWEYILSAIIFGAELIVRLTPSKKDNSILNWVVKGVDFFLPNRKKLGGKFKLKSKEID